MKTVFLVIGLLILASLSAPVNSFTFNFEFSVTHDREKKVSSYGFTKSQYQRRREERTWVCYPIGYKSKLTLDYKRNEKKGKQKQSRHRSRVQRECRWVKNYLLPQ
jgi:hypothetical protein